MASETQPTTLIGVFPPGTAPLIRQTLDEVGVDADRIRVDDERDVRDSLRAEQVEETRESFIQPQAGVVLTKEPKKAVMATIPVVAAIGAVLALPLALISFPGSSLALRLLWYAIAGAAAGGTIGFIVTAAMASKDPLGPNAAQRGVVVRVDDPRKVVYQRLVALKPLRLDAVGADGAQMATLETEEDRAPGGVFEELEENIRREQEAPPTDRHR